VRIWISRLSGQSSETLDVPEASDTITYSVEPDSFVVQSVLPGNLCRIEAITLSGEQAILLCRDATSPNIPAEERHAGRMFHRLDRMVRPGTLLHAFGLKATDSGTFETTESSRIVVEPDCLLSITELVECFFRENGRLSGNPRLFFLHLFTPFEPSLALVRGKLVNDVFDYVLQERKAPDDVEMERMLSGSVFILARIPGDTAKSMRDEVRKDYLPSMMRFADTHQNCRIVIEPAFIAPEYGLQGRLDVLLEENSRRNVVELKSGKPPGGNLVWDSHAFQVTGYNLLLSATYANRKGDSAIFYPRDTIAPLRNVYPAAGMAQRLLMLRNEIVRTLFDWAEGRMGELNRLNPDLIGPVPKFTREQVSEFGDVISDLDPRTRTWFEYFVSATATEMLRAKTGFGDNNGFASLWRESRAERARAFISLDGLQVASVSGKRVEFSRPAAEVTVFRPGDIIIALPAVEEPLRDHPLLKGAIESIAPGTVSVVFWGIPDDILNQWPEWSLERDMFDRSFVAQFRSLYGLLSAPVERRELLLGMRPPLPIEPVEINRSGLSDIQAGVVAHCLGTKDLHLVLGPPGTGKTSLIMNRIVRHLYGGKDTAAVFVLAFTNRAVDEIASRLQGLDFLRLGRESDSSLRAHARRESLDDLRSRVLNTRILIGTVFAFLETSSVLQAVYSFDTVLIDEASQLTEPQLAGIVACFRRSILIGDHRQLPPVTTLENFREIPAILRETGYESAGESLFERLFRRYMDQGWDWGIDILPEHYRMHADIAELVNPYYDNELQCAIPRQSTPAKAAGSIPSDRVLFVPSQPEMTGMPCHRGEATAVVTVLNQLRMQFPESPERVGVITPFRAQISLIRSLMGGDPWMQAIMVDTVERFQGSENDVILFSAAVDTLARMRTMQSIRNGVDRKLNVAVSRAREQFILFGDPRVLNSCPHYTRIIAHATIWRIADDTKSGGPKTA
jgi:thymidine kinase